MNSFLVETRQSKNLSQAQLAHLAGLDTNYICRLENKDIKPGKNTIEAIASVLKIEAELLEVSFGIVPRRYVSILQNYPAEMKESMEKLCRHQKNKPGKLITFEGIEGSGKSTQIYLLHSWLQIQDIPTVVTREPGGTELGATLRSCLLDTNEAIAPQTELLLFAADRSHHIEQVIKPSLAEGKIVLCDRFIDSTIAYQGSGRAANIDMINQLNQIATGGIQIDLTLWLDVSVEMGLARAKRRKGDGDRIERESKEFHQRVRQGFKQLAKINPRIHRIDGKLPVADVQDEIQKVVMQLL